MSTEHLLRRVLEENGVLIFMNDTTNTHRIPPITAAISTRNRGDKILATIESIFANEAIDFDVLVIDQSTNEETAQALQPFYALPNFTYIATKSKGASRGRNMALQQARTEIVAFTDDDCMVPTNWLATIETTFATHPQVGMLFCRVDAAAHDHTQGFVPTYALESDQIVRDARGKNRARGIGAGMAMRRGAALELGGFDEVLGPGSQFMDCEDGDLAVRHLINGWWIYETAAVTVIHDGFRSWQEGRELTRRNWTGIGAAYAKPLRGGHWSYLQVTLYEGIYQALLKPLSRLLLLKRPRGLARFYYFGRGFFAGMQTPIDQQKLQYVLRKEDRLSDEYHNTPSQLGTTGL